MIRAQDDLYDLEVDLIATRIADHFLLRSGAMDTSFKKRSSIAGVYLAVAIGGLVAGLSTPVEAAPEVSQAVGSTTNESSTDEELARRVAAALHADPYFPDQHVTVSVEKGAVVLRGFVFGDWDLERAIRIAGRAAGNRPVVDNLSIKEGGR
jgi:osmotically-inducible protein OsmY